MTSPSNAERTKAAKLRKRKAEGKKLTPEAAAWLTAYETRTTIARARRQAAELPPRGAVRQPDNRRELARPAAGQTAVVRGPQLTMPSGAQSLTLVADSAPADDGWVPVMPDVAPDAAPVDHADPTGVPPVAGSPLVDEGKAEPTGDPTAARNFGQFIAFLTGLGLAAGREMAAELALPAEMKALLLSDELTVAALGTVAASAERVAMKYGFQSVPMPDEAVVALAIAGSGFAVFKNAKRKALAAAPKNTQQPPRSEPERERERDALGDLASLWED